VAKRKTPRSTPPPGRDRERSLELPLRGKVTIVSTEAPPKAPPGKRIHPRRPLPLVPDKPLADEGD
jgi:hypothetical protein